MADSFHNSDEQRSTNHSLGSSSSQATDTTSNRSFEGYIFGPTYDVDKLPPFDPDTDLLLLQRHPVNKELTGTPEEKLEILRKKLDQQQSGNLTVASQSFDQQSSGHPTAPIDVDSINSPDLTAGTVHMLAPPSTHDPVSQSSFPSLSGSTTATGEPGPGGESQRRQVQYEFFRTEDGLWQGNYTLRNDEAKGIYNPEKRAASLLGQLRQRLYILDGSFPGWRGVLNPQKKTNWSALVEYFKASLKAKALADSPKEDDRMIVYLADLGQRVYISLNWHLERIIREENGKDQSLLWLEELAPQIIKFAKGELSPEGQNRRLTSFGKTNTDDIAAAEKKFF